MTATETARVTESVWDYPRPPRVEASQRRVRVIVDGTTVADSRRAVRVLETSHPRPLPSYAAITGHVAFYPGRVDEAWVDGERVMPQAGDSYGGWIASDVLGPFKGAPGTRAW